MFQDKVLDFFGVFDMTQFEIRVCNISCKAMNGSESQHTLQQSTLQTYINYFIQVTVILLFS